MVHILGKNTAFRGFHEVSQFTHSDDLPRHQSRLLQLTNTTLEQQCSTRGRQSYLQANRSEKMRCPSWTDRILWKSDLPVKPLRYVSFPLYVMSIPSRYLDPDQGDHKPISAYFNVCLEAIVPERFQAIHAGVLRELDKLENDARPIVSVSSEQLQFDTISFLEPTTRSLTLENIGPVFPSVKVTDSRESCILNSMSSHNGVN